MAVLDATHCEAALRQLLAARLPFDVLADVLDMPLATIAVMHAGVYPPLDPDRRERLALFTAIMTRAEIRCGHDPRSMARLLRTPLMELADRSPADAMRGGLGDLRQVHRLIGTMDLPAHRWWRVAPHR